MNLIDNKKFPAWLILYIYNRFKKANTGYIFIKITQTLLFKCLIILNNVGVFFIKKFLKKANTQITGIFHRSHFDYKYRILEAFAPQWDTLALFLPSLKKNIINSCVLNVYKSALRYYNN